MCFFFSLSFALTLSTLLYFLEKIRGGREARLARAGRFLGLHLPAIVGFNWDSGWRPEAAFARFEPGIPLAPGAGVRGLRGEQEGAAKLRMGGERRRERASQKMPGGSSLGSRRGYLWS